MSGGMNWFSSPLLEYIAVSAQRGPLDKDRIFNFVSTYIDKRLGYPRYGLGVAMICPNARPLLVVVLTPGGGGDSIQTGLVTPDCGKKSA